MKHGNFLIIYLRIINNLPNCSPVIHSPARKTGAIWRTFQIFLMVNFSIRKYQIKILYILPKKICQTIHQSIKSDPDFQEIQIFNRLHSRDLIGNQKITDKVWNIANLIFHQNVNRKCKQIYFWSYKFVYFNTFSWIFPFRNYF